MKTNFLLSIATAVLFSLTANAGGMTSTGGDTHKWGNESAWFLGTETVSYCIEIGAREKITAAKVQADFESGVKIWKAYYDERLGYRKSEFAINFNYRLEPCSPTTRLKLLVGVNNAEVEKAKKLFEAPVAFAYRRDYDFEKGLGNGFIWFAPKGETNDVFPDWSLPNVFHGMLLHELGHIFGCGHMKNTIMDENMIPNLQTAASKDPNWAKYGEMYMTKIDHHQFLLLSSNMHFKLKGEIELNEIDSKARFQRLMGRAARGKIEVTVEKFSDRVELTLADEAGKHTFQLALNYENSTAFSLGSHHVFYAVRGAQGFGTGTGGDSFLSSIKTLKGEKLLAQIDINSNELGWPVRIRYMDQGKMTRVFGADLWLTMGLPR